MQVPGGNPPVNYFAHTTYHTCIVQTAPPCLGGIPPEGDGKRFPSPAGPGANYNRLLSEDVKTLAAFFYHECHQCRRMAQGR